MISVVAPCHQIGGINSKKNLNLFTLTEIRISRNFGFVEHSNVFGSNVTVFNTDLDVGIQKEGKN